MRDPLPLAAVARITDASRSFPALRDLVRWARRNSVGSLWLDASASWDAPTWAGGLSGSDPGVAPEEDARDAGLVIGVVADPLAGRQPSVLAREVTTLDVLTGGRSGLYLSTAGTDARTAAEAATICRWLFTRDESTFTGQRFQVVGAVNRPRPVRAGGPLLWADIPARVEGAETETSAAVAALAGLVDGIVVRGSAAAVASARTMLDTAIAEPDRPPLVWRGRLPGASGWPDGGSRGVPELVVDQRAAGADGVLVEIDLALDESVGPAGPAARRPGR